MIIGILSDTHDRLPAAKAGIAALVAEKAEFLIHCGDVGGEQIIDQLAGQPAALVWGNNDWDRHELAGYCRRMGIQVLGSSGELELDGKRLAVMHGDDVRAVRRVLERQNHDYLLLGHTHVKEDRRVGRVRIINPGALHRAAEKTVALLDSRTDELRFLQIG